MCFWHAEEKKTSSESSSSDIPTMPSMPGAGAGFPGNPFDFSSMAGLLNVLLLFLSSPCVHSHTHTGAQVFNQFYCKFPCRMCIIHTNVLIEGDLHDLLFYFRVVTGSKH